MRERFFDVTAAGDGAWKIRGAGKIGDELGVFGTFTGTGLVIEMGDVEVKIGALPQEDEERDAVGTAADTDSPRTGRHAIDAGGNSFASGVRGRSYFRICLRAYSRRISTPSGCASAGSFLISS